MFTIAREKEQSIFVLYTDFVFKREIAKTTTIGSNHANRFVSNIFIQSTKVKLKLI